MSADCVQTVEVSVTVPDGYYGTVYSRKARAREAGYGRRALTLAAGCLALAAIVLLAQQSADQGSEADSLAEFQSMDEKNLAQKTTMKALGMQSMLLEAPPKAFGSYDKASGYLVNRYWGPDFELKVFQNVDPRLSFRSMISKSLPSEETTVPSTNFTSTAELQKWIASPLTETTVLVIKGQVLIEDSGKYKFSFLSNAGSGVDLRDMKNEKSGLSLVNREDGYANGTLPVEGPQMMYVTAFLRIPPAGTEAKFVLQYKGPDTKGLTLDVLGKHWINELEDEARMLQKVGHAIDCKLGRDCTGKPKISKFDPTLLNIGFGCRFQYASWKPAGVLPAINALGAQVPDAAAKLQYLSVMTFADLKQHIKSWSNASWNKADGPEGLVLAYCEGIINITTGGDYIFSVESYGEAELKIEGVNLLNNLTKSDHISLPTGYHDLKVGAIFCTSDKACPPREDAPASPRPILEVSYSGADPSVQGFDNGMPVEGSSVEDGIGDLEKLKDLMSKKARKSVGFTPERNAFADFDKPWYLANKDHKFKPPPSSVADDDNLESEVAKIIQPMTQNSVQAAAYAADGATLKVPDAVYNKPPPYDPAVVDIGGKGIGWIHKESWNDLDNEAAVIGKSYEFTPWGKTIKSVSDPSPDLSFHHPAFAGGYATPPTTFGVGKEQ